MKTLSLYVDKWYIIGAINTDGSCFPLVMPDGEDRIWLYFFEDRENQCIRYGKAYKGKYNSKEPRHIGDVFSLLTDGHTTFQKYPGQDQDITEIFNTSGIFEHIREVMELGEDDSIDVYLCFSDDIEIVSQFLFRKEFVESGFSEKNISLPISKLAISEANKRHTFSPGKFLVMEATNENMRYSFYDNADGTFEKRGGNVLGGYGVDPRGKVLVDFILENLKVKGSKEEDSERLNLYTYADKWLRDIDRNGNIPYPVSDIRLASEPYNPKKVTVKPKDINERTKSEIYKIADQIVTDIKKAGLTTQEFVSIVFIGDVFSNEEFRTILESRFNIGEGSIVRYGTNDLYKIVNIFNEIDCNEYSEEYKKKKEEAKDIFKQKKEEREKEERDKAAAAEADRIRNMKEDAKKAERNYKDAIEKAEEFEHSRDYRKMEEWANVALSHRPDDSYAKEIVDRSKNLQAEERIKKEQFNRHLEKARKYLSEKRWNDAIYMCEYALELTSDSKEAQQIKNEAKTQLDIEEKIKNYTNRCDLYYAQKLYDKASNELDLILSLRPDNDFAIKRKAEISELREKSKRFISELSSKYRDAIARKDFQEAVELCKRLEFEDVANSQIWRNKRSIHEKDAIEAEIEAKRKAQNQEKLNSIRVRINTAVFDEKWSDVVSLCDEYLAIEFDEQISTNKERAIEKLNKTDRPKPMSKHVSKKTAKVEPYVDFFDEKKNEKKITNLDNWDF